MEAKRILRAQKLALRNSLSVEEADHRSIPIIERVLASKPWQAASTIGLYAAVQKEVRTAGLFYEAEREGKRIAFPRVVQDHLEFRIVKDFEALALGSFGIPEPSLRDPVLTVESLDLVLLPGIAFDASGGRLGTGAGYYDKTFPGSKRIVKAGLGYDFQYVEHLPREPWDVPCDWLFFESKTIAVHGG